MANTIRNVTIVVPVLMTSCHVSEKPNNGPVTPHTITMATAATNANGVPAAREHQRAKRVNSEAFLLLSWVPSIDMGMPPGCLRPTR